MTIGLRARRTIGRLAGLAIAALSVAALLLPGEAQAQSQRCFQLEQQLQRLSSGGQRSNVPRLRSDLRRANAQYRQAQARADRSNCYSTFFFTQSLKNTPRCVRIDRTIRRANQRRRRIEQQLRSANRPTDRRAQRNQIIRALARNRCGAIYQREARRTRRRSGWNPFASVFGEGFGGGFFDNAPRDLPPEDGIQVGSTYRTMCVRTCDGFYYPVSFATLPSRFQRDASQCASTCAAPSELFVYRNPGAEVEQMVSLDGRPYSKIKNAFRYRKEYIKGCTCHQAEYNPAAGTNATAENAEGEATEDGGAKKNPAPPRVLKDGTTPPEEASNQSPALPQSPRPKQSSILQPSTVANAAAPKPSIQP